MKALRCSIWLLALGAACAAHAQTGSRLTDPPSEPPSRFAQEKDNLEGALRAQTLTAAEPRDLWIAGQLDSVDPWAQASALAQARTRAPTEMIYVASLASACLAPVRPLPPECDAVDRLADWAIRDGDNGVPVLLLAERARARNNAQAMVAFLEEAATRSRFDDYRNRGALLIWEAVRALPGSVDPAARAELAATLVAARESYAAQQMQTLCRDPGKLAESVRNACAAAGSAAAQRAATWSLRAAGARLAQRSAAPGSQYDAAQQRLSEVQQRTLECAQAGNAISQALESSDASVRARAVTQWEARLAREARIGEVAACQSPG
jgi:hypothetical protein